MLKTCTLLGALALISVAFAFGGESSQAAFTDAREPGPYQLAVQDAYDLINVSAPTDAATHQAISKLEAGTGQSQPEILADLRRKPPDYADATTRMAALLVALNDPANTADPQLAQQRLHDVLAMPRYDLLHRTPSPVERFLQWARDWINWLWNRLFGGGGGPVAPNWVLYVVGAAMLVAVAIAVFSSARGRLGQGAVANQPPGPRAPADYFAEADRLAAEGDRIGAIRALCAGVAATLSGEQTWVGSPLTVREIFQHASDPARLLPLLIPFEAAVYGGREVDAATYERAAQVAAPFRQPAAVAA